MTLKKAPFLLLALALSTPLALLARGDGDAVAVAPNADQSNTSKLVYGLLSDSRYAYRPRPLDDALSQEVFKRYFEALDGGKQFFTAADVARFAPYKTKMDDAIRSVPVRSLLTKKMPLPPSPLERLPVIRVRTTRRIIVLPSL